MFSRALYPLIQKEFFKGRAVVLVGARQTGKTTLVLKLISEPLASGEVFFLSGDDPDDVLSVYQKGFRTLSTMIGNKKFIFIDEAHKIPNIGNLVKILVDRYKAEKQCILTASSSINLLDFTAEPLTGRKRVLTLYPLSLQEIFPDFSVFDINKSLEEYLLYGLYPTVVTAPSLEEKKAAIKEIAGSSLYKDILEFQKIKNSTALRQLLTALALQLGNEVSTLEIEKLIKIDRSTIERYIDLLEKNFVLFRLPPFSKNKRRTLSKHQKIYFYDVGVRNAIINNFNPLSQRNDVGVLWENFLLVERLKWKRYGGQETWDYFWRTYDGAEIDFVEETHDHLTGYEIKWEKDLKKIKAPRSWFDYPKAKFQAVNRSNFVDFIRG